MSILVFLILIAVLVLIHESGHFLAARRLGVSVEEFGLGFPPRLWHCRRGQTVYSLNLIPLGGFVRLKGEDGQEKGRDSFASQAVWRRLIIIIAGVVANFLLAWLVLTAAYNYGAIPLTLDPARLGGQQTRQLIVANVLENSPAAATGMQSGDILSHFTTIKEFQYFTSEHKGQRISLDFSRRGDNYHQEVALTTGEAPLGVALAEVITVKLPWWQAAMAAGKELIAITTEIFKAFGRLIYNIIFNWQVSEEIVGPVGIFQITGTAWHLGWIYFVQLAVLLTINLAIINALPLPALDGGRLLFLLVEWVSKGRRVRQEVENFIHTLGFALLILLLLLITYRDLLRL